MNLLKKYWWVLVLLLGVLYAERKTGFVGKNVFARLGL